MKRKYMTRKTFEYLLKLSSDIKSFTDEDGKQKCGGIHIYWIDRDDRVHNCYIKAHKIPEGLAPIDLFCPNEHGFNNVFYERGLHND